MQIYAFLQQDDCPETKITKKWINTSGTINVQARVNAKIFNMLTAMIVMFVIGYILIALEHQTGIIKTAIALLLGILL